MTQLVGFILMMTPVIFALSLVSDNEKIDIWEAVKLTISVDLGITMVGLGVLVMVDGGLIPL